MAKRMAPDSASKPALPPSPIGEFARSAWQIGTRTFEWLRALKAAAVSIVSLVTFWKFGLPWGAATLFGSLFVWALVTGVSLQRRLINRDWFKVTFTARPPDRYQSSNKVLTLRIGLTNHATKATFTGQAEWLFGGVSLGLIAAPIVWMGRKGAERELKTDETADIDLVHVRPENGEWSCALCAGSGAVQEHREQIPQGDKAVKVTVWCDGKDAPQSAVFSLEIVGGEPIMRLIE